MITERRKASVGRVVYLLLSIALLVFLAMKSQAALSNAKEQLQLVKPVWETGLATTATAVAEGETTKTRIFFKAQDVRLEYFANGMRHTCLNRMIKKDFDKIDGADKDGRGDVMIRYIPADPSFAATEQAVNMWKKEKDSYFAVKWICIIYCISDAIALLIAIYSIISYSGEIKAQQKRLEAERERRRQQEEAARLRELNRRTPQSAPEKPKPSEKPQPSGKDGKDDAWDDVLSDALKEAQNREKKNEKNTGISEEWKKVLDDAAEEAKNQKIDDATVYEAEVPSPGSDATVYEAEVPSPGSDATVYEADVPSHGHGSAVYKIDTASFTNISRAYENRDPEDGTVPEDSRMLSAGTGSGTSGAGNDHYPKGYELSGTYRIESEPIVGGMGNVWKVHHTAWDVDLAMKRPKKILFKSDKQKEDFIGECEAWINLGIHPNIVACYYVREIDGVPTIFSEWMENGSLAQRISDGSLYSGSPVEIRERLLDIAIQFAEGLHYAHRSQLIHRDVKPANLLLTNEWEARVADFGIAQMGKKKTNEGGMTPAYCSPEQAAGKKLSRRTDLYSWAVSVLEMYLGRRPWKSGTMVGLACREYFDMAKIPIPDSLRDLLAKCLDNELKNRPRDFASVIKELKAIYREVTARTYPRPAARVSGESADNLNNRALSYLDLGRSTETEKIWTRAALMAPAHTETLFNRCLYGYRSGKMSLYEAQCFLSANWENHFNQAEPGLLLAELSLEGGDPDTVRDVLSYVRNYSTQQEELSEQAEKKLDRLESMVNKGSWHCAYQLSRVKNYKEQEELQNERDKRLRELKNLAKKGKWDEAGKELMISHLGQAYGDALYQEDWLAFYDELTRKCTPVVVLGQWPIMTIPRTGRYDRVSFSDDSRFLLCGEKLYDLETGELVRDNGFGYDRVMRTRVSGLSPDGSFYLCAPENGKRFSKIDARTGENLAVCTGHEETITALAISRDGKCFASGDEGGTLKLWDSDGSLIRSSKIVLNGDEPLEDIQFGYDNRKLVLRYENYVLLSDQVEGTMDSVPYDNYMEVAVNLGYTALGMAVGRKGLHYLDLMTNEERVLNDEDAVRRRGRGISTASQVCFMHNQRFLLASDGNTLFFFNPEIDKILSAIHMGDNFESIAISRNGKYVAAISGGKAQLWQCIYGLRYSEEEDVDDVLIPCAHVQCSAHPEKSPEELLKPLMEELADRGYGAVDTQKAFEALRAAHG